MTNLDAKRLERGRDAASMPVANTIEAKKQLLESLHDGLRALQSLDDLGSPEANDATMKEHDALLDRILALQNEIKAEEAQS